MGFFTENSTYSTINEIGRIEVIETDQTALDDDMLFYTKGNNVLGERMRIQHDGNVGIGTTNPSYKLEIDGGDFLVNTTNSGYVQVDDSDNSLKLSDNVVIKLGTGSDFQMLHNGSSSSINNFLGNLFITQNANDADIIFRSDDGSGGVAEYLRLDGGLGVLYFSKNLKLEDNVNIQLGNSADFRLYHASSDNNSYIDNYTGNIILRNFADDKDIVFKSDRGDGNVDTYFYLDGSLTNNSTILGATRFPDKSRIYMGTDGDLQIYHDGSNSYIQDVGTGDLRIDASKLRVRSSGGTETQIIATENAGVELFYNDSKKFETTSTGATVTGNLTVSGGGITLGGTGRIQGVDTVSASTDAANKAYVDAQVGSADTLQEVTDNGNTTTNSIGIGTTNPSEKLEVVGKAIIRKSGTATAHGDTDLFVTDATASSSTAAIQILGGNAGFSNLQFSDTDSYSQGAILYGHADNYMAFKANAGERMRITSSGNVGIGITNPSTELHVAGDIRVAGSTSLLDMDAGAKIVGQYYGNGGAELTFLKMYNPADASINMGTKHSQGYISFAAGSGAYTERMRIKNNGNVGIGTTNPSHPLQVDGIIKTTTKLYVEDSSNSRLELSSNVANQARISAHKSNIGQTLPLLIQAEGIKFGTLGGGEKMRMDANGNVGIGTTNPTALLDVATTSSTNVKVTKIANDITTVYRYATSADAVLEWTCGSYHNAEVVITASQTNGGTYNNLYIRGIWSNNHTSHHWDELEHVGSLTGTTFTITNGQNGSTAASGRLTLGVDYVNGSFATLNIRITDFFGTHSYTIT